MDWILLVLVLGFALRGFFRGTVAQVFGFLGLVAGLWAAAWISHWVGQHWQGARPALVFLALRWLVAGLGGMAVASIFQWWGQHLGEAVKGGLVGWLDRTGGLAIGAALGAIVVAIVLLVALSLPLPKELEEAAARARVARPLMRGGARACAMTGDYFPGSAWLRGRFVAADRRAGRLGAVART